MVESPDFRILVTGLAPNASVTSRKTLAEGIFDRHANMIVEVERLFSIAGLIHSAKHNHWSDNMFETLVLLKANRNLL